MLRENEYFKEKGNSVTLIENYEEITANNYKGINNYDAIYISKVFSFTKIDTQILSFKNVYHGGTGFYFSGGKIYELLFKRQRRSPEGTSN